MAFYNGQYVGLTINRGCVIEAGTYRLVDAPNTNVEPCAALGNGSYFYADMPLNNSTKLSWSYGLYIDGNGQIIVLTAPASITYMLTGTTIYKNGAYVDAYSNKYRLGCDVYVTKGFYDWWNENTVKE